MLACVLVYYIFMCGQEAFVMPLLVVREKAWHIDVELLQSIDIMDFSTWFQVTALTVESGSSLVGRGED